jgi:hypothetical protein
MRHSRDRHVPNAIDEVMDEVEDLLQASREGQALGRLRNSYSSLLLAHARLVGLGRRVDRSYCEAEGGSSSSSSSSVAGDGSVGEDGGGSEGGRAFDDEDRGKTGGGGEASHSSTNSAAHSSSSSAASNDAPSNDATRAGTIFLPPLLSQPPLPPNLTQQGEYSDVAYVEYLNRSGMELHHRRTGRGMQHDAAVERAKVAERNRKLEEEQIVRAARGVYALSSQAGEGGEGPTKGGNGGECGIGRDGEGEGDGMTSATTAMTMGTRIVSGSGGGRKRKGSEGGDNDEDCDEVEDDDGGAGGGNGNGNGTRGRIGSAGGDDGGEECDLTPSKRKGGRGKKPPTLVMHTMAGGNLDVRELMRGIM